MSKAMLNRREQVVCREVNVDGLTHNIVKYFGNWRGIIDCSKIDGASHGKIMENLSLVAKTPINHEQIQKLGLHHGKIVTNAPSLPLRRLGVNGWESSPQELQDLLCNGPVAEQHHHRPNSWKEVLEMVWSEMQVLNLSHVILSRSTLNQSTDGTVTTSAGGSCYLNSRYERLLVSIDLKIREMWRTCRNDGDQTVYDFKSHDYVTVLFSPPKWEQHGREWKWPFRAQPVGHYMNMNISLRRHSLKAKRSSSGILMMVIYCAYSMASIFLAIFGDKA